MFDMHQIIIYKKISYLTLSYLNYKFHILCFTLVRLVIYLSFETVTYPSITLTVQFPKNGQP